MHSPANPATELGASPRVGYSRGRRVPDKGTGAVGRHDMIWIGSGEPLEYRRRTRGTIDGAVPDKSLEEPLQPASRCKPISSRIAREASCVKAPVCYLIRILTANGGAGLAGEVDAPGE